MLQQSRLSVDVIANEIGFSTGRAGALHFCARSGDGRSRFVTWGRQSRSRPDLRD
jgi:hypothetical protein